MLESRMNSWGKISQNTTKGPQNNFFIFKSSVADNEKNCKSNFSGFICYAFRSLL